ncbi:hypothetical protein EHP00_2438 [Ecytonucleospora hepatopenaei]|uniref:Uncharacterized protein n=1 Tax=Ecytonucleospora hepatopenaei TaxID=646526 RepID=A0A1W0E2W2_9MICR|nr:hypothetical protein EHP00_2438 [Ecytonucleospora hepatopenaei]
MHTNNIIFFTLLGISKSIEFIFLIYFIIYHYNELVTNTNTMYISLMSIIVFYMFNIYALLFTVVKDPGIVAPRAYGSYDLIDIELVDGTVIHVNVEEDRREVYIKYNTDIYNSNIYNSNIYNSNIYNSNILKNTDIYNTNIFNTNILYTKYENIK